jgi:hypothetical protein
MLRRKTAAAALVVLLGMAFAILEETFIHTDDGCVVETHCNACLLLLGTPGVPAAAFSLVRVVVVVDHVVPAQPTSHEQTVARKVSSRGPPPA